MNLVIKEGARADITEGYQQYNRVATQLGDDFLDRLDEVFDRIRSAPERYAQVFERIRQVKMRRFPYVVSYLFENECVIVLAVLHGHRNPSKWQRRV